MPAARFAPAPTSTPASGIFQIDTRRRSSADQASAAILNAQAAIDLANINLGYTRVVAPFDGVVTNHQVDIGALVGAP